MTKKVLLLKYSFIQKGFVEDPFIQKGLAQELVIFVKELQKWNFTSIFLDSKIFDVVTRIK